ncbi:hypothetical protein NXS19_014406 [Fusarium pseudograminearum]|nr:hypothetical protein NXS19_014406 [Fusarium pseudograminearum]
MIDNFNQDFKCHNNRLRSHLDTFVTVKNRTAYRQSMWQPLFVCTLYSSIQGTYPHALFVVTATKASVEKISTLLKTVNRSFCPGTWHRQSS